MSIKEFDQTTTFTNPDLPSGALSSKQFNTIVELLSEGEIEGSATASKNGITDKTSTAYINSFKKDIFLNQTPILQSAASVTAPNDSDFNFQDVGFEFREGTSNQTFISGIKNIETEVGIGTVVTTTNPVTHTVNQSTINAVRVTLQFPAMQVFNNEGGIDGTEVNLLIKIIENDGTTTTAVNDTVKGRSTNAYNRDYLINLKSGTSFPVQIRVERVTADSTDSRTVNAFRFSSATNIIMKQNAYPNTAHVGLRFSAEKFPRIPNRRYRIRGVKVKIPSNATVNSTFGNLTYAGTWNGTFKADKEWCSDPAWILYDLLTNTRYGCNLDESNLDKFTFKTVSEYCGGLVDDGSGTGSTEPRFSVNVSITQQDEAYNVINALCSTMRAIAFYTAGGITISQDAAGKATKYIFNNSNITEDGFVYNGSSLKTRHTVIHVQYFDMTTQELDFETVEADASTQAKYGVRTKNIKAFACTSRGQASRLGKWFLFNEQNSGETCSFTTTLAAGVLVRCGDIIEISDSLKSGNRRGGLLESVTSTTVVVLDDENSTDIPSISNNPTLSIVLPSGALEQKTISNISGKTITVSSAFSETPNVNAPYILETSTLETTTWKVVSASDNGDMTYTFTALEHNEGKYAFVEDGTDLPTRSFTKLTTILDSPLGLQAEEQIVQINNKAVSKILIDWQTQSGASRYELHYRVDDGSFTKIETVSSEAEIVNSQAGKYEFRVFSFNAVGEPSRTAAELTFDAIGKTAIPADVKNLKIEPLNNQFVRLRFDKSTETDVVHGGNVVIRSSNLTTGATFTNAVDVLPELSGSVSETIVPNIINGTYLLRFKDDGGRLSSGDASVVLISTTPDVLPKLTVLTDREDLDSPPFQGTKVDCFFSDEVNGLVLGSTDLIDDVTDFDAIADFDFLGAVDITGGSYSFANTLDLGGKQPLRLIRHFVTQGFYPNDLFDSRTANLDDWTDFDGATAVNVNAKLLVATTDSDPDLSVSATYAISGTTITITKSSHGYSVGSFVTVDFTSGTGVDGDYEIKTVPNANTFTLTSATSLTTSGNCTYSAEFSQFNSFVNGTHVARGFKFKCEMDSNDPAQSIEIDQLGYTAEIDSRTETSLGNAGASTGGFIESGTSTKSVTFTNSFFTGQSGTSIPGNSVLPSIGITIENAVVGDFFALSNISSTGFDIDIKNGSSHVNRNFKYTATGFGRGS